MERELNQINVIPLVDVMLVLLVIVLTTATFISTGQIPVELAEAKEAGARQEAPLVLTLTAEGHLFLNDQPVSPEGLPSALQAHSRAAAVVVRADREIRLARFVGVVDEVRGMGFTQLRLEVARR